MNFRHNVLPSHPGASQLHAVDRFVCIYADTEEARQRHYEVRYRVFCEETGFEDPDSFPTGAEHDRYDAHAKHIVVWDRYLKQWAGAMRLVDASTTRLPSETIVGTPLQGLDEQRFCCAEFSRLCILKEYRQISRATFCGDLCSDAKWRDKTLSGLYRQEDNDVLLRLLRASFGWRPAVERCYFIVTAALSRVLTRFGIPLVQVGQRVEHRGTRIPYRFDVADAEQGMLDTLPGFAAMAESGPHYVKYSDYFGSGFDRNVPTFSPCLDYPAAERQALTARRSPSTGLTFGEIAKGHDRIPVRMGRFA